MKKILAWHCHCLAVVAALFTMTSVSQAQESACLNQLVPCLEFINSDKPPSSRCCGPLKTSIKSDPQCLCSLLGGGSAARQAGVNMTGAQHLPARCGEKATAVSCTKRSISKGKTSATSSAARFLPMNAVMVALLLLMFQCMWMLLAP